MLRLGIDIGGTKTAVGLFDHDGKRLLATERLPTEKMTPQTVRETADRLAASLGASLQEIASCGIGVPGTVSEDGKRILKAPNLPFPTDALIEELEATLAMPAVALQDSRAAAWGAYLATDKKHRTLVSVTLGTGIGTGIVVDGKIYHGALGCAGELGHLPMEEGGRPCGCGKRGCLEKYVAGGGLDITARELLGEGATARELFVASESDPETKRAIETAREALGRGLVSIINLLSPDYLCFSGGLAEEARYLLPLIDYIKTHCYEAGTLPVIERSPLGENAPLFGAAFYPEVSRKADVLLSASIMCADVLHFEDALRAMERAGIAYVHADVMDNHFVPNLMLPPELLSKLHGATRLPFDYHLMTQKPETVVERLDLRPGDIVSIHAESTPHLRRELDLVRERGAHVAVALNPATPLCMLDEVVDMLDFVLVMTVNPGFAGQKLVEGSLGKIERTRAYLDAHGREDVPIEVDGNCSFENVPGMRRAGANIFVVGTSSVFHRDYTVESGTQRLLELLS